ncbi:hypothetical protein ABEB36_005022 [Hypothenemus hampei]|uniref:Uncharacterized protein n=1 Tax=Hypothenemus hampei TaxID=57062 RepID=A0ABD1F0J6_HYPHA
MAALVSEQFHFPRMQSHGKGRLYCAYSLSGSEGEDSVGRRYADSHTYQHPLYQQPAGLSDTPTSENASDATLTDSELALARDSTLLVHNGGNVIWQFTSSLFWLDPSEKDIFEYRYIEKKLALLYAEASLDKILLLELNVIKKLSQEKLRVLCGAPKIPLFGYLQI